MNGITVRITAGNTLLEGILEIPQESIGLVIFAHGSGSSRHSPRNNFVADILRKRGIGTLLFDLLTEEEDAIYETRFDMPLLIGRLIQTTNWIREQEETKNKNLGYFGSSTGAAAAFAAAAHFGHDMKAVVSRGGRPDLAQAFLPRVKAASLLIVGEKDTPVIDINKNAYKLLKCKKELEIVDGASHLFEEPGALTAVANQAAIWFEKYLK